MGCPSPRNLCVSRLSIRASLVLIFVLTPVITLGQDASTAALRGVVMDSRGALVEGATVTAVSATTGIRNSATTNREGIYFFDLMPPGDYSAVPKPRGCRRK